MIVDVSMIDRRDLNVDSRSQVVDNLNALSTLVDVNRMSLAHADVMLTDACRFDGM